MKKILAFILTVILLASAVPASAASEYLTSQDGAYNYTLYGDNAVLERYIAKDTPELNPDGSYTIPSEIDGHRVTTLGDYLFAMNDVPAENVIIPDTVTVIESNAFAYEEEIYDEEAAKKDPEYEPQYEYLSKLKKITIPESVVVIERDAFHGAPNLEEVTLPDSLRELGENAFYGSAVKKVTIGKRLKTIGTYAFADCKNLSEVVIPESVTKINKGAFWFCDSLKRLDVNYNTRLGNWCYGADYAKPTKGKLLVFSINKTVKTATIDDAYKYHIPCAVNLNCKNTVLAGGFTGCEFKLLLDNEKPQSVKTSDKKIVSVKGNTVKILVRGNATLTATDKNGAERKIRIMSFNNPTIKKSVSVKKGKKVTLELKGRVYSIENKYTNTKTAKIYSKKKADIITIKGLKKGKTTLKVKVNGVKTLKISVKVV